MFYRTRRFFAMYTRLYHLVSILSQINPSPALLVYLSCIIFIYTPRSFGFPYQKFVRICVCFHSCWILDTSVWSCLHQMTPETVALSSVSHFTSVLLVASSRIFRQELVQEQKNRCKCYYSCYSEQTGESCRLFKRKNVKRFFVECACPHVILILDAALFKILLLDFSPSQMSSLTVQLLLPPNGTV